MCPAKFNEFRYDLLPHPAFSPHLIPCDYFLFPNLKKWFGGKRNSPESSSSPKQRLILKGWTNHIIRTEKVEESLDQIYRAERRLC